MWAIRDTKRVQGVALVAEMANRHVRVLISGQYWKACCSQTVASVMLSNASSDNIILSAVRQAVQDLYAPLATMDVANSI